jgi:ferredoxin|tara:strand:+ start:203 stop:364 length:162 start_codon:yes stop_codon:yes gene_type:complete
MFDLLLYADINCTDAVDILNRIDAHERMSKEIKVELVETIQEATPHCPWDAND